MNDSESPNPDLDYDHTNTNLLLSQEPLVGICIPLKGCLTRIYALALLDGASWSRSGRGTEWYSKGVLVGSGAGIQGQGGVETDHVIRAITYRKSLTE